MTVHELLTGQKSPLTAQEYNGWMLYFKLKSEMQK